MNAGSDARQPAVCIVGLGKIGLPLAVQIAGKGRRVIGADINQAVVDLVNAGTPPFPGEDDLDNRLSAVVADGMMQARTETQAAMSESDVVVVVVPLIIGDDYRSDFAALDAATEAVGRGLRPGTLVSYETTLPVGTTRKRFAPRLAELSGLVAGEDFFVCHSPERVSSGRVFADLRKYPKLVGGVNAASTESAAEFYESILDFDDRPDLERGNGVWSLASVEAAELTKLAETTYRDVNIAFANELAIHADSLGADISEVIAAANSQPFSHIHQPGIAVGGHCIPVYPHLYLQGDPTALMPSASRQINDGMPKYAVDNLAGVIGPLQDKVVAVLGLAFRGGVKEAAFSGVFAVVSELERLGAIALVHDPLYDDDEIAAFGFRPYTLGGDCDGVVVQADHAEYSGLTPDDFPGAGAVVDGRRVLDRGAFTGSSCRLQVIGGPGT